MFLGLLLLEFASVIELFNDVLLIQLHLELLVIEVFSLALTLFNQFGLSFLLSFEIPFKTVFTLLMGIFGIDVVGEHIVLVIIVHGSLGLIHSGLLEFLNIMSESNLIKVVIVVNHCPHSRFSG